MTFEEIYIQINNCVHIVCSTLNNTMSLDLIRKYIKYGLFNEARKLIELANDVYFLMAENGSSTFQHQPEAAARSYEQLPLLIILSIVKDEENALSLARLLIEKGYHLDMSDRNGMCALNYAIALNRANLVDLLLSSFNVELNTHRDCYKNSLLHYVFAVNNFQIIEKFGEVYSKYYEWDLVKFENNRNCDGLSVQDLYNFSRLRAFQNYSVRHITSLPDYFKLDSNPIKICKFINQVFP